MKNIGPVVWSHGVLLGIRRGNFRLFPHIPAYFRLFPHFTDFKGWRAGFGATRTAEHHFAFPLRLLPLATLRLILCRKSDLVPGDRAHRRRPSSMRAASQADCPLHV